MQRIRYKNQEGKEEQNRKGHKRGLESEIQVLDNSAEHRVTERHGASMSNVVACHDIRFLLSGKRT